MNGFFPGNLRRPASLVLMKTLALFAVLAVPSGEYSSTIDHPYLPLSAVRRAEFERRGGSKKVRVVRRVEKGTEKVGGVDCLVLVEEEYVDGALHEVARNFFAQKDGAVWYFGEDVDNYKGGKVDNHDGSWRVGKQVKEPALYMPAVPKKGDTFKPEDVKGLAEDAAEILEAGVRLESAGKVYEDVLKIKYTIVLDDEVKVRFFARGLGFVREEEDEKILELTSLTRTD